MSKRTLYAVTLVLIAAIGGSGAPASAQTSARYDELVALFGELSEPVLLADLTVTDFMVHTDDGHLVALQRGQKRNDPDAIYCFSLAGVTRLALPAGYNGGQGWTGANGRVYGVGYQEQADGSTLRTPLVWDVSGAGGC